MPRLDNSCPEVIEFFELDRWGASADGNDIEADVPPVDVCVVCDRDWKHVMHPEHPPYEDEIYRCWICSVRLDERDN